MTHSATAKTFRVGQLATKVGKTIRTIHFYEELGLLQPAARSKGGFRLYDDDALTRIHWIDRLQQLDFSLTEIRDFLSDLNAIDTGPLAMEKLRRFYTDKLEDARESIAQYKALAKELQESLVYLAVCEGCGESTPRSACGTCEENEHEYIAAPALVAAVNESA